MRKTSQKFSQSHMLCKVALVAIMLVFQAMLGIFYCCTDDRTHCIGYVTSNLLGLLHSLIRCDLGCESLLRGDAEKTQGSYTSKQLFSTFKVHTIFVSWLKQFGSFTYTIDTGKNPNRIIAL